MLDALFALIVFPGFGFSAVVGMLASWLDRKITARVQYRVGPPFMQPYYDLRKLFAKEITVPRVGAPALFAVAPIAALSSAVAAATVIGAAIFGGGFAGDIILVLYLLMIPPLATALGALASENPLAAVGASREIKLMLAYEAVFILSIVAVIIKTGSVSLAGIIRYQLSSGPLIFSVSGFAAFLLVLAVIAAKLGIVPFDMAEAETEIAGGVYIEYSGALLAFYKLSKTVLLAALPLLATALFFPSTDLFLAAKYAAVVVVLTLIRNTNPRFRIDHALGVFWGIGVPAGVIAIACALAGR